MKRTSTAFWQGSGKEGSGHLSTQSPVLNKAQYSHGSRFAEGAGTNPEELIAAAHAGCFTMKLSFVLGEAGFTPKSLETSCTITIEEGSITTSHLDVKANIEGISEEKFAECANEAKSNCPVSKLLKADISLKYTLN